MKQFTPLSGFGQTKISDNQITKAAQQETQNKIDTFKVVLASIQIVSGVHAGKQRTLYSTLSDEFLVSLDGEGVTEMDFVGTNLPNWFYISPNKRFAGLSEAATVYNALESELVPPEL